MQIVNTSTPANHFHLLRRQVKRDFRKPLVVFSPKMLLRYPEATSSLSDMANGNFKEVLDDLEANPKSVDTVVLCSGKFYYEMKSQARALGVDNMAFIRLEQLYPLPEGQIRTMLSKYQPKNILWAQEEPANMGAWSFIAMQLRDLNIVGITRRASAASAEGSKKLHEKRLNSLMESLFSYGKFKVHK